MTLTALRLIEVEDQKVNVVEFRSFSELKDYAKSKTGKVGSTSKSSKDTDGKKLIDNKLRAAVQEKKESD